MELSGIHHLTAVTSDAPRNYDFYTKALGLRLVKKTVNQDDVSAYHLFYADGVGSPGTDITFFDWPVEREQRGTRSITRTGMRVGGSDALVWWKRRLHDLGVAHSDLTERDGRLTLDFEDFEGQRLSIVDDTMVGDAHPWEQSTVPAEFQIRGLGPVTISVPDLRSTEVVLTKLLGMTLVRDYAALGHEGSHTFVYQMRPGGAAAELHVAVEPSLPVAQPGAGGVHHVAFRIPDVDYEVWAERLSQARVPSSGPVDRFWFRSLYLREPNGILFEIATDGPGFATDEPMDKLGETLSLPPFLEGRRRQIEAGLQPLTG